MRFRLTPGVLLLVGAAASVALGAASSGVQPTSVRIAPNPATGMTIEQENTAGRLTQDNEPGAVQHLYVLSAATGQPIMYSTVRGKVTSSGKRLSPRNTIGSYKCGDNTCFDGFSVQVRGEVIWTKEILGDDGTYGSSAPYLYWWDTQGRYHQHFLTDGQIIDISDQPLSTTGVVINMDVTTPTGGQ